MKTLKYPMKSLYWLMLFASSYEDLETCHYPESVVPQQKQITTTEEKQKFS